MTASAHIRHQRRTEKDEDKKKAADRTGTGTETSQPTNLSEKEPDYSNIANKKSAQTNDHHGMELKAANPDKRKG